MRTSMAYLAGAGTVVITMAAGIGGGLVIGNIMSPQAPKQELSKLERRGATETPPSTKDPLVPVPYIAATQAASSNPVVVSPSPQNTGNAAPQTTQAAASAPSPQPSELQSSGVTASHDQSAKSPDGSKPEASKSEASKSETSKSETSKSETSKSEASKVSDAPASKSTVSTAQPAATREQASTADDSYAKARDADLKRAAERRKAERRSQWTDRRRYQPSREQELRDVEESVRGDTETRVYEQRPVRIEYPQVRFFDVE